MYKDQIQYILNHVNLFWFYLFMKIIHMWTWNPKSVKPKIKHIELMCVCVNLSISTLSTLTQDLNSNKLNTNRSLLVELFLQADSIQTRSKELDSIWVLDAILTRELLNIHVLAPKTSLLKQTPTNILINNWNYINTRSLIN